MTRRQTPFEQLLEDLTAERYRPTPPSPGEITRRLEDIGWSPPSSVGPISKEELRALLEECEHWELRAGDGQTKEKAISQSIRAARRRQATRQLRVLTEREIEEAG